MTTQAIALWAYKAQEENEISFEAGDQIEIIELCNTVCDVNQDWYEGIANGISGFFPANHVRLVGIDEKAIVIPPAVNLVESTVIKEAVATVKESVPVKESVVTTKEVIAKDPAPQESIARTTSLSRPKEPRELTVNAKEAESDTDSLINSSWRVITTETGQVYYWNEETGQTSWTPPDGFDEDGFGPMTDTPLGDQLPEVKKSMEAVTDHIEVIPPELIRREGTLSYKIKKDFGGIEPKRAHSWHTAWGVVCVGFLVFYKDEPTKLKKKSDKPVLPMHVVKLDTVLIKRDVKDASKKNLVSIQSRSGALVLIQASSDSEVGEWFTCINDATRENSTAAQYQNAISKIFVKNDLNKNDLNKPAIDKLKEAEKVPPKKKISVSSKPSEDADDEPSKQTVKARLNNFFKRVGDLKIDKTKEKLLPPNEIIFGGSLENLAEASGKNVPDFVQKCITHVQQYGLDSQGIYRLSGNAATVQKFRTQLNHNNDSDLFVNTNDVNIIAALLKLFFREIQVPVIPFTMYNQFIDAMKVEDYNNRLCDIKTLVQKLPKVHYDVLETLMRHLVIVASHSEVNKMEPFNLAIVFGPSLIRQPETNVADMQAAYANMMNMSFQNALIESMIIQTEWLFDGNPN